jgi:SAM-dependent methyltransferase
VGDETYDARYYAEYGGMPYGRFEHWTRFFGTVADHIVSEIGPRRVLDAGCALGLLVEALRTRGVDAEGVDLSSYAIANVYEPIKAFCRQGSIGDDFGSRYDLIVSFEVVEHLPAREGEAAVANICRHTDDVLLSSTPFHHHHELSHVNVQPSEYWAELFARHGFYRDVAFDASFISPWAVRFRRSAEPLPRIVRDYERWFSTLAIERNEIRRFSLDLQQQLADALARARAAEGRLGPVEEQLAQARATIERMQASLFWKMRRGWVSLNRLVGRSR